LYPEREEWLQIQIKIISCVNNAVTRNTILARVPTISTLASYEPT
jgi:hypothetical protein